MHSPGLGYSSHAQTYESFIELVFEAASSHNVNFSGYTDTEKVRQLFANNELDADPPVALTIAKYIHSITASKTKISLIEFSSAVYERIADNTSFQFDKNQIERIIELLISNLFPDNAARAYFKLVSLDADLFKTHISRFNSEYYKECAEIIITFVRHNFSSSSDDQKKYTFAEELTNCFFDGLQSPSEDDQDFVQSLHTATYLSRKSPEIFGEILMAKTNDWATDDSLDTIFSGNHDLIAKRRIFARATLELTQCLPIHVLTSISLVNKKHGFVNLFCGLLLASSKRIENHLKEEPKGPISPEQKLIDVLVRHSTALSFSSIVEIALWDVPNQNIDSKRDFPTQIMFSQALQRYGMNQESIMRIVTSDSSLARKISLLFMYKENQEGNYNLSFLESLEEKLRAAIESCSNEDISELVKVSLQMIGKSASLSPLFKSIFDRARTNLKRIKNVNTNEDISDPLQKIILSFFDSRLKHLPCTSSPEDIRVLSSELIEADYFNYLSTIALLGSVKDKTDSSNAFLKTVSICKEGNPEFEISAIRVISDSILSYYPHAVWGFSILGDYPLTPHTPQEVLKKLRSYLYESMKKFHELYFDAPHEITDQHRDIAALWLRVFSLIFMGDQRTSTEIFDDTFLSEVEKLDAYGDDTFGLRLDDTFGLRLKDKILKGRKSHSQWEHAVIYECCERYLFSRPNHTQLWNQSLTVFLNSGGKQNDFSWYFSQSILMILQELPRTSLSQGDEKVHHDFVKQIERRCFDLIKAHTSRRGFSEDIIGTGLADFLWREILPIAKERGFLDQWKTILPEKYFEFD